MKVALIFAEFGRPLPNVKPFLRHFPGATARIYTEQDCENVFGDHPRWGWRMNDYWKVAKLLDADADIAISFDSDMRIVSDRAKALPLLADRFGLCLPANPRHLVSVDTAIGADSDGQLDESLGTGYAVNCSPIAINLHNRAAVEAAETYLEIMQERPVRGPLAWWRAFWQTGHAPYLLPPQWCVCQEHIGIGGEIILHEGHEKVQRHYATHRAS